jgi:hypothetical protein
METPSLGVLERVHVPEGSPNVVLLPQIAAAMWNGALSAQDLLVEVKEGRVTMWHIRGIERGVALLRIEQSPQHRTLVLDGIAGHNVLRKAQAIGADLVTIARFFGCVAIEATTTDPRWEPVTRRLGFVPVSVNYLKRID